MSDKNHATVCPGCGSPSLLTFYEVTSVPVYDVLLLHSRDEALNCPKGDIILAQCNTCGFIFNQAFDPALPGYASGQYESTQHFSATFNRFSDHLAQRLVEEYQLYGKRIIEIGCGQGEFLTRLCEIGGSRGLGFDPAYVPGRGQPIANVEFIADYYSEKYGQYQADFICCKMTLEHIDQTGVFIRSVRRSIGDSVETTVFFQVPNAFYVFRDVAFWDVYYEHCSYFSPGTLAELFRASGFEVINVCTDYNDQYVMLEAKPTESAAHPIPTEEDGIKAAVAHFRQQCPLDIQAWRDKLLNSERRVILWGGGSKAVAFLTTLKIGQAIEYVVDVNPYKHGTYIAGAGQMIVSPPFIQSHRPDQVIVMNPIYVDEVRQTLQDLGVVTEVTSV